MTMTRHQVRAARILLRLSQDALADKANMGVATLRRYEGGQGISPLRLKALREAIEAAGAVLIAEAAGGPAAATGAGVVLLPPNRLPDETRERIEQSDATDVAVSGDGSEVGPGATVAKRRPGRPRKRPESPLSAAAPKRA